jgi:peroxiredoxin
MTVFITRFMTIAMVTTSLAACKAEEGYRPLQAGDPAPEYAAPRLGGDTLALSSLRGSPVLLNLWATWCAPCRDEMPGLQTLHERYHARGLDVVGASTDARGAEDAVRAFISEFGITFTILHDADETANRLFRTNGLPETFLIDADGNIAHRWIGRFEPLAPDVIARIEGLLVDR